RSYEFDVQIQPGLNDNDKQQMLADLMNMRSAARQGGLQSMSEADYLLIENMIRSGRLKQAQIYTAYAVQRRQKQAQAEQQQMIQQNGKVQQQSLQMKQQGDAQAGQQDAQNEAILQEQKLNAQAQQAIQLQLIKNQGRLNEIRLQSVLEPKKSA